MKLESPNFQQIATEIIMSWQDYITTQLLGKNLKEGAIAGIDGQIWSKVR